MNKKRISQLSLLVAVFALLLSGCDSGAVAKKTSDVAERTGAPNSSPAAANAAQSDRSVEVIQSLADADLVVGKDTVVHIMRGNGPVTVDGGDCKKLFDGDCNASSKDESGATVIDVGKVKDGTEGKSYTISAAGKSVKRNVYKVDVKLKVFFLPVDWTSQERNNSRYDYKNTIPQMSSVSCEFMKAVYPVPPDNITCQYTLIPYMLRPYEQTVADANGQINWTTISAMYASAGVAGRRYAPDATVVVAVLPPGWFGKHMNSENTLGLELGNIKGVVTSQMTPNFLNYQVAAHEIGHTFGLLDDYNFGVDPPRNGWFIDSDGFWRNKPNDVDTPHFYAIDDTNAPGGGYYSFMGAAGGAIWVNTCTYDYLRQAIGSGKEPTGIDCANSPGSGSKPFTP